MIYRNANPWMRLHEKFIRSILCLFDALVSVVTLGFICSDSGLSYFEDKTSAGMQRAIDKQNE